MSSDKQNFLESDAAATERFVWWGPDAALISVPVYSPVSAGVQDTIDHWVTLGFVTYDGLAVYLTPLGKDLLTLAAL